MSPRQHPHLTLPELAQRLWTHPRRLGFMIFNVVIIVAIVALGYANREFVGEGLAALPMTLLGTAGTTILFLILIGVWVAWAIFLIWRHRPHRD